MRENTGPVSHRLRVVNQQCGVFLLEQSSTITKTETRLDIEWHKQMFLKTICIRLFSPCLLKMTRNLLVLQIHLSYRRTSHFKPIKHVSDVLRPHPPNTI